MPWEFLGAYVATKALDAAWRKVSPETRALFIEKSQRWLSRTLAERHLTLQGQALVSFYRNESPMQVTFADRAFVLPAVLSDEPVASGKPSEQRLTFSLSPTPFGISNVLDSYVRPVRMLAERDGRLFDGKVVRLADLSSGGGVLSPASYYDALATNFAMDHKPAGRTESLREFLHTKAGSLGKLPGSLLVNHIGVVCMVETADGMLVVQRRSSHVANRPRSLSASVSGALNWTDIWRGEEGISVPLSAFVAGAVRESLEEIGADAEHVRYLGMLREYLRGGKPEVYLYARTSLPMAELAIKHRRAEGRKETKALDGFEFHSERVTGDDGSRYAFQERVRRILDECSDGANFTFVAGTLLSGAHVLRLAA